MSHYDCKVAALVLLFSAALFCPAESSHASEREQTSVLREILRQATDGTEISGAAFRDEDMVIPQDFGWAREQQKLQVTKVVANGRAGTLEFVVRCRDRKCLPFYVLVRHVVFPSGMRTGQLQFKLPSPTARQLRLSSSSTTPRALKAGELALLVISQDGMRATMPVIMLQSARAGEHVRVRPVDGGAVREVLVGNHSLVSVGAGK